MTARLVTLALVLLAGTSARASKPVERTLVGCVVGGALYSVDGRAYRMSTPQDLDLAPYEGKGVSLRGWLSPGDRFEPATGEKPVVKQKTCPTASLRLIKRDQVINLRVAATKSAKAGEHARAMELIGKAMAVLSPPECDTFTDRAHVLALQGELAAVKQDLAVIKAKKQCFVVGRMNPLLLRDLGNLLVKKGDRPAAVTALQLALAACDGDWCRPDIKKDLQAARQ